MSLETKLYTVLSGAAGVTTLCSTRIYPLVAPQDAALPLVVYNRISSRREYSLAGYTNLENPRIQIDSYGATYSETKALSEAVVAAVRAATTFAVSLDESWESYEEDESYRVSMDFSIWNSE